MLYGWKENSMLTHCLADVPIYLQQFPSYTMLTSMRKSKNRYFYHIFVSPRDASGAITLNVISMEREFDAYKLSRCMCRSNYYRFWDTARYLWKKIVILSYSLHSTPPLGGSRRNIGTPFGMGKLEWCTDTGWRHLPRWKLKSIRFATWQHLPVIGVRLRFRSH